MKKIIGYLLACLALSIFALIAEHIIELPDWLLKNTIVVKCSFVGAIGGILYCIRAVYLNKCVRKNWDEDWHIWYYLRPLASTISGFVSFIFLKAGLLVLDAATDQNAILFGYLAIAFIAGYNVDNFLKKIESVACEIWGIKKSRSSNIDSNSTA